MYYVHCHAFGSQLSTLALRDSSTAGYTTELFQVIIRTAFEPDSSPFSVTNRPSDVV